MLEKIKKWWSKKSPDSDGSLLETIGEWIEENNDDAPNAEEKMLVARVIGLREVTADDIMVPRADIVAAPLDISYSDLVKLFSTSGFTRIPIYRETLDDVMGYVDIKDVLEIASKPQTFKCTKLLQQVLFISPSMRLLDLLLQQRATHAPIAIVVDEFGGVDGMLTASDILQYIVDEMDDFSTLPEEHNSTRLSDGSFVVNARLEIDDLEKKVGKILTPEEREEDIDTVGGLVAALAGHVPQKKEIIVHPSGVEFEVLEADPRRVKSVKVRRTATKPINKDSTDDSQS